MKKLVVFGSKGNLGQEICKVFSGYELFAWDKAECDITDREALTSMLNKCRPDIVINCAAYNDVDGAESEGRSLAENINGNVPGHMAEICKNIGAIFVHYSSGQVFSGDKEYGCNEDDAPSPVNAYGASKLLGETEAQNKTDKLYIIRTEWLYGHGGDSATSKKSFVDIMLEMSKKGMVAKGVVDEYGKPTYTKDLAHATRAIVEDNEPFGIYHVTNSGVASLFDWANEIFQIAGGKIELTEVSASSFERKAKRPKYEILNNNNLSELRPWQSALREYLSSL